LNIQHISEQFAARKPGHALSQFIYNAQDMFSFDLTAIYAQSWLFMGFEAEVRAAGDYLSVMIGAWPIMIVRGRDGVLRAFHNTCRHRGSVICPTGAGNSPRLTCPYHRWTYDLNGKLIAAGRMAEDFDKSAYGLMPVHLETVAGVIFICLAETPPPFEDLRAELGPMLKPHNFESAKVAAQSTLIEYANWKMVMENARECYHCATGHPELAHSFPVNSSAHFDRDGATMNDFHTKMEGLGLPSRPVEEEWWQAMRFPLNPGYLAMSFDGQFNVKKLMVETNGGDTGSLRWALEPHHFAHSTSEYTFTFSAMPVGPHETHVHSKWLVHEDAVEGVDYDVDMLTDLWMRTNLQDKVLAENNQLGVNALGYIPGPYCADAEPLTMRFVDWYCAKAEAYLAQHHD
jgi:Rieske 2Fe-2S family protein